MHMRTALRKSIQLALILAVLVGSLALVSAEKPLYTKRNKAFFADENTLAFVRPGLKIANLQASIAEDGTIKASALFTDDRGVPLDREGIMTPGTVVMLWTAAVIPNGQKQYRAYTVNSIGQAANDSGGVLTKLDEGVYEYTFRTKAPTGYDRTAAHRVSVSASRDLTEWDLGTNLAEETVDFVPNGSPVTVVRDVVRTETCNKCHERLALHSLTGRTTVEGCIMCHQPQSVDPESGNTVDMKVMIHKIHMGAGLPSVRAGTPYQIIGRRSVHDYSKVVYPPDVRRCTTCHDPDSGAAQHDIWITTPTREGCGSCHDNVNFATGENHAGLPQVSDNQCAQCHQPQGELEFDISILGAHTVPLESRDLPGTVIDITDVSNAAPGKSPIVSFTAMDKQGNPLDVSKLDRMNFLLVGPTTDYPMAPIAEDARAGSTGGGGRYNYTFKAQIPADAKGSWAVGVEARQAITLLPGTVREQVVRDPTFNDVMYFSVDGSPVEPRRTVVDRGKCNACHANLSLHGDNRNAIEYCVMCHSPSETDAVVRPASAKPDESIDFRTMIHRIHTGRELGREYIVYGFRGSVHDYSHVGYPGARNNCEGCHVNDSYQVPLQQGLLKVNDPRGWLNPVGPESAACLGCHGSIQAASHALANTTELLGESCAACHGDGKQFSVDKVHAQ